MKQAPHIVSFDPKSLDVRAELHESLQRAGYSKLTPIQANSIAVILEGSDLIAQAKTGSGKTAAFALGILNQLDFSKSEPQALVLCPTRELASQVSKEIRKLASSIANVNVLELCGGSPESKQKKSLEYGAHILVGTPGRIKRLQDTGFLPLEALRSFVLDEADAMLDLGFYDDIHSIAKGLPSDRQTLLFSASYPEQIQSLSKKILRNPDHIVVDEKHLENVIKEQFIFVNNENDKLNAIDLLLSTQHNSSTLIFCHTKVLSFELSKLLKSKGFSVGFINGDLEQRDRIAMLTKFANKSFEILVATDVASRGLDIENVQMVINYNLPKDVKTYTHRIGRTGRAGQTGQAISFYTDYDGQFIEQWEAQAKKSLQDTKLSSLKKNNKGVSQPTMVTLYINGGKKDKLRPGDILGALTGVAKLPGDAVGNIDIGDKNSYVAVQKSYADQAIKALLANKIKKKKFKVGRA